MLLRYTTMKTGLKISVAAWLSICSLASFANALIDAPIEVHQRIATQSANTVSAIAKPIAALTLDACGGAYDGDIIRLLVAHRVPATIFVTKKWMDRNPVGMQDLLAHPELFEIEDHGAEHIPAVIGAGRRVYGILGQPDMAHLHREIEIAAADIRSASKRNVTWYRGATAEYDRAAITEIEKMGYKIAGFSVNADAGATLNRRAVADRLSRIKDGDIIIAHMNKPRGDTAEGFSDALPQLLARGFQFVTLNQVRIQEIQ
jgi:peptidoglycan/xylan/chitin deacetylase (PgdA/CDA1 family)